MDSGYTASDKPTQRQTLLELPPPKSIGTLSVEEAIARRRSTRFFTDDALSLDELSQLLWAVQGKTGHKNFRATPSAGATFPLEVFAIVGGLGMAALPPGIYLYVPAEHALQPRRLGDFRYQLTTAAYGQDSINTAPISLIITADYERTRARYRLRTERYVHMEAGHAAQNLYLQATAMGLGTVAVGAFDDSGVRDTLNLPSNLQPLYLMPVGTPNPDPPY